MKKLIVECKEEIKDDSFVKCEFVIKDEVLCDFVV